MLLKENNIKFEHNGLYGKGLKQKRYDFWLKDENIYIEVTTFLHSNGFLGTGIRQKSKIQYLKNIVEKRRYATKTLQASFEFINRRLTVEELTWLNQYRV